MIQYFRSYLEKMDWSRDPEKVDHDLGKYWIAKNFSIYYYQAMGLYESMIIVNNIVIDPNSFQPIIHWMDSNNRLVRVRLEYVIDKINGRQ